MKTIDELWKLLKDVELVQVRPSEMEAIYKHCFEFPVPLIVEIGSAHGASSIILAEAAKELSGILACVDTYPEDYYKQDKFGNYARKAFKKNLTPYLEGVIVELFDEPSAEENFFQLRNHYFPDPIDVLFIDGMHSYEAVKEDCANYLPLLRPGGYVAFHDYNNHAAFPGVKKAADEATGNWEKTDDVWDLIIRRKP